MITMIFEIVAGALILLKIWIKLTTGKCTSKRQLKGKTIIITGSNSGIGKAAALDFARRGARVILACRNPQLALAAVDEIRRTSGNDQVIFKQLDVSKQTSIRKFAQEIINEEERLDVLINNAGMGGSTGRKLTEDGVEVTFAINYFGPFLLTNLLLDKIKESGQGRIIHVSSLLHLYGHLEIDEVKGEHNYNSKTVYWDTKLALNMFSKHLAEKLNGTGVTSNCLHPGAVNTEIFRRMPKYLRYLVRALLWLFFKTPEEGAQTTIHLAVAEEVENVNGKYFCDCKVASENPKCFDKSMAEKLWNLSTKLTNLK